MKTATQTTPVSTTILYPIVEGLTIAAADGKETTLNAKDVFPGGMYGRPVDWDAAEAGGPTGEIKATVCKMREKDAMFKQMFDSLNTDTKRLCLTPRQIKKFVKEHRQHLCADSFATLFLFEDEGEFFVAFVCVRGGRFRVHVYGFESVYVWRAVHRHRVVVPQLETV